jgi:hypothetical protein
VSIDGAVLNVPSLFELNSWTFFEVDKSPTNLTWSIINGTLEAFVFVKAFTTLPFTLRE